MGLNSPRSLCSPHPASVTSPRSPSAKRLLPSQLTALANGHALATANAQNCGCAVDASSLFEFGGADALEDIAMRLDLLERCVSAREEADAKFAARLDAQQRELKDSEGTPLSETVTELARKIQ